MLLLNIWKPSRDKHCHILDVYAYEHVCSGNLQQYGYCVVFKCCMALLLLQWCLAYRYCMSTARLSVWSFIHLNIQPTVFLLVFFFCFCFEVLLLVHILTVFTSICCCCWYFCCLPHHCCCLWWLQTYCGIYTVYFRFVSFIFLLFFDNCFWC